MKKINRLAKKKVSHKRGNRIKRLKQLAVASSLLLGGL